MSIEKITMPPAAQAHELGVAAAASAIRNGEMKAEAYAAGLLERARSHVDLNAFISIDECAVLEAARYADKARAAGVSAPLLGVPLGVKDSYLTRGLKTSVGIKVLDEAMPDRDAAAVWSVRAAGAILFGKDNLNEMSYGLTGSNSHHGQVRNPYNREHVAGGSSAGCGAAVAARIVPAALGADAAGSIRLPAALCGVVGFKPTPGRWPSDGIVPLARTLDTAGVLARNVEDCALIDGIVTKLPALALAHTPSPSSAAPGRFNLHGIRIAYAPRQYLDVADADVERLFRENLRKLKDAGAEIVEIDLGDDFAELAARTTWTIMARETIPTITAFLEREKIRVSFDEIYRGLGPGVKALWDEIVMPGGRGFASDAVFHNALEKDRPELQRRFNETAFSRADFIVFPTVPCSAPTIANQREFTVGGKPYPYLVLARNTIPGSSAGLPGISLPIGLSDGGLPVGMEMDGAAGTDRDLLVFARRVEAVLGFIPAPAAFR